MESIWLNISTVLLVFSVAIISPGPNFILVLNRSLSDSRRIGVYSALGVATGSGLFALAGLLGVLVLFNSVPYFSTIIRYAGGCYLIYLGVSMFLTRRQALPGPISDSTIRDMPPITAYCSGLLTNLTNPKAWAFYLSLFTLMIDTTFPVWAKLFLAVSMFLISFSWYAMLALLISDRRVQGRFVRVQPLIKSILGSLLILLGGKLLLRS